MPIVGKRTVLILTALRAYSLGYLTYAEYGSHVKWVGENLRDRRIKRFVYVDMQYVGMCNCGDSLYEVVSKFNLTSE